MDQGKRCRSCHVRDHRTAATSRHKSSLCLFLHTRISTSSKKTRLQGYLAAGDISTLLHATLTKISLLTHCAMMKFLELTQEDIDAIDAAGAIGEERMNARVTFRKLAISGLVVAVIFATCSYSNIRVF